MEAWTTSVASDSILPFHLPPPHPPTWVVSGSSAAALASPQIQLRCERCCSPCVRTQVAAAAVSSSLHLGKGVLARSALLSWSAGPSLPFFVKSRTYGLAGSCAVSHPPGVARTAPSLPHLGKDVLAASALWSPSARCLCLFGQVSHCTAWLWAALYGLAERPHCTASSRGRAYRPIPPASRQGRAGSIGSLEPICQMSLPFLPSFALCGLAVGRTVRHPPGIAHTAPSLPHLGKDVLAASALRGPSARCLCLFRQVSYGTAWLWAALYSILRVAPHTPLFRTSSLGPWPLTAASEAPS